VAFLAFQELVFLGFLALAEAQGTRATQERQDTQDSVVPVVSLVSLALVADSPAFQDSQDIQVSADLRVFQGIRGLLGSRDIQGSVARQGPMERQASLVFREQGFLASRAFPVIRDSQGRVAILVIQVFLDHRATAGSLGQVVIADFQGHLGTRDFLVSVGIPVLQV
jgi:hypothetical protein